MTRHESSELPLTPFPVEGATDSGLRVQLDHETHEAIWEHAREAMDHEICGVLIGQAARDAAGVHLTVRGSIRGEFAESKEAQVTFTHRTWEYIHRERERRYSDGKIVGWYHSHPGVGIFLSGMDRFIHEHFFDIPWQVALVVDPQGGHEGLFGWQDGKLSQSPVYYVDERQLQAPAAPAAARDPSPRAGAAGELVELERHLIALRTSVEGLHHEYRTRESRKGLVLGFLALLVLIMVADRFFTVMLLRSEIARQIESLPPATAPQDVPREPR